MTKIFKYVAITLCIITITGFFLPFVNLEMSLLGNNRRMSLSLATIFQNNRQDFPFGGGGGGSDLGEFLDGLEVGDITNRAILAVTFYGISFLLVIIVLIVTIINKLKRLRILFVVIMISLFISAGHIASGIPEMIFTELEAMFGFFALFLNFRGMLSLSLGTGYWVSLITMFVNLVILIPASFYMPKVEAIVDEGAVFETNVEEKKHP